MPTQAVNGAPVEIVALLPDGQPDPAGLLDAREAATVEALDRALRADPGFQTAYREATLVRAESMRGVAETDRGRYYLRYRHAGGTAEFWGHVAARLQIDLKRGVVGAPSASGPTAAGGTSPP